MKIQVNTVEGSTGKKGTKQNKVYIITEQRHKDAVLPNGKIVDLSMFFKAIDEKGVVFELWNVHEDWSRLAIRKSGKSRYSYTDNFLIIN